MPTDTNVYIVILYTVRAMHNISPWAGLYRLILEQGLYTYKEALRKPHLNALLSLQMHVGYERGVSTASFRFFFSNFKALLKTGQEKINGNR